ncbi:hypothetical protein [Exiguobacterium alkaliphilum]|uniref:hypothetical protein n=1 Tax=Exiguobacterium alkaliphilum TaxID=1428684 RepID=UPI001FE76CDB|nr:hypothetical protein [Exiguobacterium alkaliphilum]
MQIQAQPLALVQASAGIQTNRVYKAELVKQTGPDTAIVKINGEEVELTFKDGMPKTNPFHVTLADQDGTLLATVVPAKEEAEPASQPAKLESKIQTLLAALPPEVRSAVSRLLQTAMKGDLRDAILLLKTVDTPDVPRDVQNAIAASTLSEARERIKPPAPDAPYPQKERFVELVNLSRPVSERMTPTPETVDRIIRDVPAPQKAVEPLHVPVNRQQFDTVTLPSGRQVVVKEVTNHLATVTNTFRNEQATVTKQLGQVAALVETSPHTARPALETVSTRLTQLIQKTDALLHTDATQEKALVSMTAKLDVALGLLSTKPAESAALIKEVRAALNDFRYVPNHVRLEYIPHQASRAGEIAKIPPFKLDQQLSGRVIQETAQRVQASGLSVKADATNPEAVRLASFFQVQQTLNRLDGGQLHQLLLALPAKVQEIDTGIHVHIQNREAGDVVDWENSVLYIRLETPRLGEIAVKLEAIDRNLRLTLEHDDKRVETLARPLLGKIETSLEAIGYKSVTTQFRPLTKTEKVEAEPVTTPTTGYDFKI